VQHLNSRYERTVGKIPPKEADVRSKASIAKYGGKSSGVNTVLGLLGGLRAERMTHVLGRAITLRWALFGKPMWLFRTGTQPNPNHATPSTECSTPPLPMGDGSPCVGPPACLGCAVANVTLRPRQSVSSCRQSLLCRHTVSSFFGGTCRWHQASSRRTGVRGRFVYICRTC
jgi:hypothetical protein